MIRLKPIEKPLELTPGKVKALTTEYIKNEIPVWKQPYIENALLKMSHNKCCYCECSVIEESKYLEVEHFYPKSLYPQKVVDWENLLPSCKRCNMKKGNHDTGVEPIIHPVKDDPKEHLVLRNYQVRPKNYSKIGEKTIDVLYLNDPQRLTIKRFEIGDALIQALKDLNDRLTEYSNKGRFNTGQKNRLYATLENLLKEGVPSSEYSATAATIILNEEYYTNIKDNFKTFGLWDDALKGLEAEVIKCAMNVQ
ncbi:MAG: hypothetical protein QG657_1543 [Acidobacteriota bacterium]|nr:hypothetical protein [Acidobacteriota bacterium]